MSQFLTYICEHAVKTMNSSYPVDNRGKLHGGRFQRKSRLIQQAALLISQQAANVVKECLSVCSVFLQTVCGCVRSRQTDVTADNELCF